MAKYLEAGVGLAVVGDHFSMGRRAAESALEGLSRFKPTLAMVFAAAELDLGRISLGVREALGDCPLLGTSTAGEICNGSVRRGVVVSVIASPHVRVRVGLGRGVSRDFRAAVRQALGAAEALDYFNAEHPLHHMLSVSAPGMPGVSTNLLINFSPGATKYKPSLSHDIHTLLRQSSANRIPIFGGSSGDYMDFENNFQMVNGEVAEDSIALAFVESDVLFGLGLAHGFSPTTKRALVTKASGHMVHELDGRPASQTCANILGRRLEYTTSEGFWFSRFPFGTHDVYGNSILQVPERILDDGSIQFAPLMRNDQVITLMQGEEEEIIKAGLGAYRQAVRQGGLKSPALALMFSCALRRRLMRNDEQLEIDPILAATSAPLAGFHTFGEQGLSDDGLPIYCNQAVSMLVFSDELNPVAALINKGQAMYRGYNDRLAKKAAQIKAVGRVSQAIQKGSDVFRLLQVLIDELTVLLPWAHGAFYLPSQESPSTNTLVAASDIDAFPAEFTGQSYGREYFPIWLDNSRGHRFGVLVIKAKDGERAEKSDEEDLVLAESLGKLTGSGLYRMELDRALDLKFKHLEMLNQLGDELSKPVSLNQQCQNILAIVRRLLDVSLVSLWLIDRAHRILVKEAVDGRLGPDGVANGEQNDEKIAKWQLDHRRALFVTEPFELAEGLDPDLPFPYGFASLPVIYKGHLRGVLNLYFDPTHQWSIHPYHRLENIDFLTNMSSQVAVFLENLSLQRHSTLYKEIHHRVKNNLQNVASLLRMQIRRLDRIPPEVALEDSISRIMSIAVVHETLSQGEIGLVDLGQLVGRISKLSLSDHPEGPKVSLDVSTASAMVPSRQATSLALVIAELIQNALRHGIRDPRRGAISIKLTKTDGLVSLVVQDNGPGLPPGFDLERDGNLGMTIVNTLVGDELKGRFLLGNGREGARAEVRFPIIDDLAWNADLRQRGI